MNGEYTTFDIENDLPDNYWLSILEVENGLIWVGGRKSIHCWDGNTWSLVEDGFVKIRDMIKGNDGCVWVATDNGLFRYFKGQWMQITEDDGLPSNFIWKVQEDQNGNIWVRSMLRDYCRYYPEADTLVPDTYFDETKNSVVFPANGTVQFTFTGKDQWKFTEADRLYFSHRVDDGHWSDYSTNKIATYTNLLPGSHVFEVKAIDRNWNEDPSPVLWNFEVVLPWYKEPFLLITLSFGSMLTLFLSIYALNRHFKLVQSNRQLYEANTKLLELDQMKSAFVSQASHDLRTPLTAIKSSLDNVIRGVGGGLNEKQNDVIGRALKSVDRLTLLINDVLDINRIESGREVLHKDNVLFDVLVKNAIMENQPAVNQKNITISTTGLDESCQLFIDPGKIERVVGELIGNAIKYTPEGGRIDITLSKDDQSVFLAIKDSGIGMTTEESKKIWERFYRTDASKTFAKGTGLGLSIAKELVEMHGGSIHVESQIHSESTFIVTMPLDERRK